MRGWGKWDVLVLRYNYSGAKNMVLPGQLAQLEQMVSGFNGIE